MTSGTDPDQPVVGVDLLTLLHEDHARLLELFDATARAPLTDGSRTHLVEDLAVRLQRHLVAEQRYLDPMVEHEVPGGLELAATADAERADLTTLVGETEGLDASHPRLDELLARLAARVRSHVSDQESLVFPKVRETVRDRELQSAGDQLVRNVDEATPSGRGRRDTHRPPPSD